MALEYQDLIDLPCPIIDGRDKVTSWELCLPFARCSMKAYIYHLNLAHEMSGSRGEVCLEDMASVFSTEAWSPLQDEDSVCYQFMTSELKVKKRGGKLDYNSLVIMGLLYCQDRRTPFTKAKELFNLF